MQTLRARIKTMHNIIHLLKDAGKHWWEYRGPEAGAAISYYATFSFIPLLGLIVYIGSILVNQTAVERVLYSEIGRVIGISAAAFIEGTLEQTRLGDASGIALVIGIGALIIGAFGVLSQIQSSLNRWWQLEKKHITWQLELWSKVISLSIIPVLAILLILTLLTTTVLSFIPTIIGQGLNLTPIVGILSELVPTLISICLFAYMYRFLPSRRLPWGEAFLGAITTAILFFGGRILVNLYISEFAGTSVFGTAGTFVAILIWIYISAQMFLFGASLIWAYSSKHGYLKQR